MASFHDCSEHNYNLCRHSHAMLEAVEKNSVVLLEKALAKNFGSYKNLLNKGLDEIMEAITGFLIIKADRYKNK